MRSVARSPVISAFTLIELLIVVAIIAILAAIAVPNFLEAQTRAKVSRVKADFRSLGTALETYALDHRGKYSMAVFSDGTMGASSRWIKYSLKAITSPISYISTLPNDPFIPESQGDFFHLGNTPSPIYQWYDASDPKNPHPHFPIYFNNKASVYYPGFKLCVGHLNPRQWFLISQGPFFVKASNGRTPSEFVDWRVHPYDATNGTMSYGIIVTTGP